MTLLLESWVQNTLMCLCSDLFLYTAYTDGKKTSFEGRNSCLLNQSSIQAEMSVWLKVQIRRLPTSLMTGCGTLGRLLKCSVPQFVILQVLALVQEG